MKHLELPSHLDAYVKLRRALGFKVGFAERALQDFVRFLESQGSNGPIRAEQVVQWACTSSPRSGQAGRYMRFSLVRQFLTYLKAFLPETEIPTAILVNARRPRPLLFSEEQIAAIQAATAKLWPAGSLQQITLETLLGLLASTGLRVGEALRLTIPDVQLDQEPPRLEIRHTKFRKSRFVPVHPTTADRLRNYLRQRSKLAGAGSSQFFLRAPNQPLNYKTALNSFGRLRRLLGIPKLPGRRGPAFHTLRHSFAVRRLVSWYCAGRDVRHLLPHLAVYLGHLSLIQSYHYLTATPELLTAAAERFAEYAQSGGCQ